MAKYTIDFLDPQLGVNRDYFDGLRARGWGAVDLNTYGQVAGHFLNDLGWHPTLWSPQGVELPGHGQSVSVWMYDEHRKRFSKVVDRSPVAKAVVNLIAAKVALDLRNKLESDGIMVNRAQYAHLAPFVDDAVKAVNHHLETMREA